MKDEGFCLVDHKGRVIFKVDESQRVLFGRHKDMLHEDKELLLDICEEMASGISKEDLLSFLNFEQEDFCS